MRRSDSFLKTKKEAPADETALNAKLLTKAGYIHKEMAGVYNFLPLGKRVMENIMQIIREEMNAIGGEELYLGALQSSKHWEKSGRWHDEVVDVWFKTRLHGKKGYHMGPELGLGNTHEEALTALMQNFIHSYKDLPVYAYQFQTKFRNEPRAKSGLLRCREFIMKDLYSFSSSPKQHEEFYEKAKEAYKRIFDRLGLGEVTYLTLASGGSFSKFSHEFQTIMDVGEDTVYIDKAKNLAINKEVFTDEAVKDLGVSREDFVSKKAVEVGNIFPLGTRFSEALGLFYTDEQGENKPVVMGSYGIGPARVMGVIAELLADDKGLIWPKNVAPYDLYLARLGDKRPVIKAADELYKQLTAAGISIIYDDRDARPGEMFADADLLGLPYRLVVSDKTLADGVCELKPRSQDDIRLIRLDNPKELVNAVED